MVPVRKWIPGTSAEQPLTDTARQALSARLGVVWHHLQQAARPGGCDRETIHQLRVWSRRAVAALAIFHETLPSRRARWFEKQMKRVRQAAGAARDLDVLAERFERDSDPQRGESVARMLDRIRAGRLAAQPPILQVHRRLRRKEFDRRMAGLLRRIRWRGAGTPPNLGQAARARLGRTIGPFFEAASGDLSDVAALHQLRIAGKQLRYAMELFAGAFQPSFRDQLYPQVEELQERLGAINDHAAAAARFQSWLAEIDDPAATNECKRLLADERAAMQHRRREFFAWWSAERRTALERGFVRELTGAASKEAG